MEAHGLDDRTRKLPRDNLPKIINSHFPDLFGSKVCPCRTITLEYRMPKFPTDFCHYLGLGGFGQLFAHCIDFRLVQSFEIPKGSSTVRIITDRYEYI